MGFVKMTSWAWIQKIKSQWRIARIPNMNQYKPIKDHHKTNNKKKTEAAQHLNLQQKQMKPNKDQWLISVPEIKSRTPAKNTQLTKFLEGEMDEENRGMLPQSGWTLSCQLIY